MEYIKFIQQKLFYFCSPMSLKFNISDNLLIDFLFSLPQSKNNETVSIFLKNLLVKFSQKFLNLRHQSQITCFIFYISVFTIILENLQIFENNFSMPQPQKIIKLFANIQEILLYPFNIQKYSEKFFEKNSSILKIQSQLENDLNDLYNHLFSPEEISLLSILIITNLLDSENLLKPNLLIKSFNEFDVRFKSTSIQVINQFTLCIEYDLKIEKIFQYFSRKQTENQFSGFKIGFITDVNM